MTDPLAQTCRSNIPRSHYDINGVRLTRTELAIINYLLANPGTQAYADIARHALGYQYPLDAAKLVKGHIFNIRSKLGRNCIYTDRVLGRYGWTKGCVIPTHQWKGKGSAFGQADGLADRWNTGCIIISSTEDVTPARVLVRFEDGYEVVTSIHSVKPVRRIRNVRPLPGRTRK